MKKVLFFAFFVFVWCGTSLVYHDSLLPPAFNACEIIFFIWLFWTAANLVLFVKMRDVQPVSRKKKIFSVLATLAVPCVYVYFVTERLADEFIVYMVPPFSFLFFKFLLNWVWNFLEELWEYIKE